MVYQISGITKRINRESTSGRTIRKLPLTNRSGLGVLDNPRYTVSEKLRIIQFANQMKTALLNEDLESRNVASGCGEKEENLEKMYISMIYVVRCSPYTLIKLIWHESSILRVHNILRALSD